MSDWTNDDAIAARKQGWGVYPYSGGLYRRRGANRWGSTIEFQRWFERQVLAGDELCTKARAYQVYLSLTT